MKTFFKRIFPVSDDPTREKIRKVAYLAALVIFLGSAAYLVNDMVIQPACTQSVNSEMRDLYRAPQAELTDKPEVDDTVYPEGMADAFRSLYRRNADVRGWLTFQTTGNDLFEGAIDNPVVQTVDNDYYLNHDFLKNRNKGGTLYFDYRNDLSKGATNRNLIIYGHNLNSGLMFSRLNLLATGKEAYAKRLTTLTVDTLYEQSTYKVFAVLVVDASAGQTFPYTRTDFADNSEQQWFVEEVRKRSLYDFGDVDVDGGDELLTLSTCSNKRDTHLSNGRLVVVARKLREGETEAVNTAKTVYNTDVLMPRNWYVAQGKDLPKEYLG